MAYPKEYSEATAERIDSEIDRILEACKTRVKRLIEEKKSLMIHIAGILTEREVIEGAELKTLIESFEGKKHPDVRDPVEVISPP